MALSCVIASNAAFAPTGYGTQTRQLALRMQADGHHVAVAANYGVSAQPVNADGLFHYPSGLAPHSDDIISAHCRDWWQRNPDGVPLLITLYDVWPLQHPSLHELPTLAWVPIDHDPAPPTVLEWLRRENVRPVAMSRFGSAKLTEADVEHDYVPHAVDTGVYRPTATVPWDGDERPAREVMGVPEDARLIISADANKGFPSRKGWGERADAVAEVMRRDDSVWWYIHSTTTPALGGVDMKTLLLAAGVDTGRVRFSNQYAMLMGIAPQTVAAFMTAADVLLSTSYSEGFGLTSIEAQACGTPVVVSDFSAQPELVGEGWTVPVQRWWDHFQSAYWAIPNVGAIVDALMEALKVGKQDKARDFVLANYDADTVYVEQWRPVLAAAEARGAA